MHVCYEYLPTTTLALCNHKRTTNIETTKAIKGLENSTNYILQNTRILISSYDMVLTTL